MNTVNLYIKPSHFADTELSVLIRLRDEQPFATKTGFDRDKIIRGIMYRIKEIHQQKYGWILAMLEDDNGHNFEVRLQMGNMHPEHTHAAVAEAIYNDLTTVI